LSSHEKISRKTTNFLANLLSTKFKEPDTKLYIYLPITLCRTGCSFDIRPVNKQSEHASYVRKVLRLSLQKIQNSTSQLMLPAPFEVVLSAVNTLLPAFLQFLKAAGECLIRNACELHRRSRLNSLDILMSPSSLPFFQSWKQKKSHGERSGEYGGCGSTVTLCLVRNLFAVQIGRPFF
jgi:hypothetical protein